ncbi:MAG: tetratricopeptide repeat protein [Planctomycetota bacterium]
MNKRQHYRLGMSAYNSGRYAEAVEHLSFLASDKTGASGLLSRFYLGQAHYHLAVSLFKEGKYPQAAHHFGSAALANPSGGNFARFMAVCHVGTGRYDLAARELENLLNDNPDDLGSRIRLALIIFKQGRPVEANALIREGLRRHPDNAELHYQLGVMLAVDGELSEAEKLFDKTVALDPSHARACEKLAQCYALSGRYERALNYLEQSHRLEPQNAGIALQLNLLTQSMAVDGYRPVVEIKPPTAHELDESSIDKLGEVIANEPDFVQSFLSLPASDVDNEVFSTLAVTLDRALHKHPEYADLHYHCGEVYNRLGKKQDAIDHVEQAVRINPRYVNALILLANLYGQTDGWEAGVKRLEQSIHAGADYPDVHYLIGKLYQSGGQKDCARQAYRRALELNENYQQARDALTALPA